MDHVRRLSFGSVADLYDRRRPSYPEALVDDLIDLAGGQPLRALEVGAGTGKATVLFAQHGVHVDAVEPSAEMAAINRRNTAAHPNVTIVEAEFESLRAPEHPYDLIYAGQAWHWIDRSRRYALARAQLRSGGLLAPFWNRARWEDGPLKEAVDEAYRIHAPELMEQSGPQAGGRGAADPIAWGAEIAAAAGFEGAEAREYEWETTYTAPAYAGLLGTHSDHATLEAARREPLLAAVAAAINDAGGALRLHYVTRVLLARAV